MSTELPYEIKYLIPVIEELEKFDPDELGDDNQEAMDIIDAALEPILKDLSDEEAAELLKNHLTMVQEWQKEVATEQSTIGYIQGAMMGMLAFKYNDYDMLLGNN